MNRKLSDIAEIRSGFQFRGAVPDNPNGNVWVVQIKDLTDDFEIRTSEMLRVQVEKPESYRVQEGDVLFLSRGYRLGAAIVPSFPQDLIASSVFFVLRPSKEILPEFLRWTLNSRAFADEIRPLVRGSHMPMLSKGDFNEIRLDVPPLETQWRIVSLASLQKQEALLRAQLERKRALLFEALCLSAAKTN